MKSSAEFITKRVLLYFDFKNKQRLEFYGTSDQFRIKIGFDIFLAYSRTNNKTLLFPWENLLMHKSIYLSFFYSGVKRVASPSRQAFWCKLWPRAHPNSTSLTPSWSTSTSPSTISSSQRALRSKIMVYSGM